MTISPIVLDAVPGVKYTSFMSDKSWSRVRTEALDRRDQEICRVYDEREELSLAEIGEMFNLSKQRVWQIITERPHERMNGR